MTSADRSLELAGTPAASTVTRSARSRATRAIALVAAAPALAFLLVLMIVPVVSFLGRSFTGDDGGFTWEYYEQIFTVPRFATALFNSLWVAAASTAMALALALPASLYLATLSGRAAIVVDAILTFPLSLPGVVIGFFIIVSFGRAGLANAATQALTGHPGGVIAYAIPGLLIAYLYFQLPRVLGTLRGAASSLDPDLPLVARTLGASSPRIAFTVTVPAMLPSIAAATGVAVASSLGAYGTVAALSEGFRVLPLEIAEQGTMLQNTELAGAMAILLAVISLAFTLLSDFAYRMLTRRQETTK